MERKSGRRIFNLDQALRSGESLPPGVSIDFMASADSVEVGTAQSDFDFLDGRWVDVRSGPDITRLFPETVISIDDAELNFKGGLRLSDGTLVASAIFESRPSSWLDVNPNAIKRLPGAYASVAQGATGFGHWLLQRIGRIYTARDHCPDLPLISTVVPHRCDDYFRRIGYDPDDVIRLRRFKRQAWRVDSLKVTSYSGMNAGRVADAHRFRRDMARFLDGVDLDSGMPAYPERVYLGRRRESSTREGMANGEEIERIFLDHGYEFIDHARLPFDEQVRVIRSAKVIAGESGSFAQNAMFGAPGLTVVVVCANNGVGKTEYLPGHKTYGRMATDALGLGFRRINASPFPRSAGWIANPDIVRAALKSMPEA